MVDVELDALGVDDPVDRLRDDGAAEFDDPPPHAAATAANPAAPSKPRASRRDKDDFTRAMIAGKPVIVLCDADSVGAPRTMGER